MAKIVVSSGYSLYGQGGGRMPSPNFTAWDYGRINLDSSVTLSPGGLNGISLTNITVTGTDLSISPDFTTTSSPDIITRDVSGIVESFSYLEGTGASHGSISAQYVITGLSISFEDLLGAGVDPLTILLSGDDEIIGSSSYDTLKGYDGNDVFLPGYSGRYPSNTIYDQIDGGNGIDTISYADMVDINVFINLTDGTARRGSADAPTAARMVSIENAIGSALNDTITGDASANDLTGGAGNDTIYGLNGHDRLFGDAGNDRLFGGNGSDVLYGGDGNDLLRGDAGADLLNGFAGIDTATYANATIGMTINLTSGLASDGDTLTFIENIVGTGFDDVIVGLQTNNKLQGGNGNDQLFGLAGNDRLEGQTGDDALFGGDGNDYLVGSAGNDGLFGEAGHDRLYGGEGNDYLAGGDGNDTIVGEAGDDQIDAGAGDDSVVVGAGNDGITLGFGDDIILYSFGNGQDTIFDFGTGHDVIDLSATNATLLGLQAIAIETAAGVLFQDGYDSILLAGLTLSQLDWTNDFVFAA